MSSLIHLDINQIRHNEAEVLLMRLNGINIYDRYTNRIEYTVNKYDSSLSYFTSATALHYKDPYEQCCAGLPRLYLDSSTYTFNGYDRIKIIKTDGTSTNDTRTTIGQTSKVMLYFPEETCSISFYGGYVTNTNCYPLVSSIIYCNTSNLTSMKQMFYNCTDLMLVNTNNWDTSKVISMASMFHNCICLRELDLSSFDTNNVTDMSGMFYGCYDLAPLDVSNFATSKVINMSDMFNKCFSLTELDVSNFDTNEVNDISRMFNECKNLTSLDVTFATNKVVNMSSVFRECNALTKLDLSSWDTGQVTNMSNMFDICNNLISLDLSTFDTSNVADMNRMFFGCESLTELNLSNWDMSKVTSTGSMFMYCDSLYAIHLNGCNNDTIAKIINSSNFPKDAIEGKTRIIYCEEENAVGLSAPKNWVFSFNYREPGDPDNPSIYVPDAFKGNKDITEVVTMVDSSHTDLSNMFASCSKLVSVNTQDWDTSNVVYMNNMFFWCNKLTSLDLSNFDTSKVTNMNSMFYSCQSLTTLDLSNFNVIPYITDTDNMLYLCLNLHTLRLDNCNNTTISKIISSSGFPIGAIDNITRTIYCKRANAEGLTAPTNWVFSYID